MRQAESTIARPLIRTSARALLAGGKTSPFPDASCREKYTTGSVGLGQSLKAIVTIRAVALPIFSGFRSASDSGG